MFLLPFFALLPAVHFVQLQALIPSKAFCHPIKKTFLFCAMKPERWHKETNGRPVLCD